MENMEIEEYLKKREVLEKQVHLLFDTIKGFYEEGAFKNDVWYTVETLLSAYVSLLNIYIKNNNISDEFKKKILNDFHWRMKEILKVD